MKPTTILYRYTFVAICTIVCLNTHAQQSSRSSTPKMVLFNFQTKQFTNLNVLDTIEEGDYYSITISNINSNLYKISIGKEDSSTNSPISVPGFGVFNVDVLQKLIGGLSPLGGLSVSTLALNEDQKNDLLLKSIELQTAFDDDFDTKIKGYIPTLDPRIKKPSDEDAAKALIEGYQEILKSQLATLNRYKTDLEVMINSYNRFLIVAQFQFGTSDSSLSTTGLSIGNLYRDINLLKAYLDRLDTDVKSQFQNYLEKVKEYDDVIRVKDELKKGNEANKASYQEFTVTLSKAKESVSAENILKYVSSIIAVTNNQSMSYSSIPIQFSKELAILKLDITPRDEKLLLQAYHTEIAFPLDKRDKFWGVSSGFYWSTMHDDAYSVTSDYLAAEDTTLFSVLQEKPGKSEFGINALVHFGKRIKNNTFGQFNFGPAVSMGAKIKPRLLVGGGLGFGDRHKFLISLGLALGYADRLSKGYHTDQKYITKPGDLTVSTLTCGGYFSVSYLFFK